MSRCTTSSSNLRPINRLTANSVWSGLVTACRLALWPTRTSPLSEYATIEGVVRSPSVFSITRESVPSTTATHEFVVPRSIPIIFAMFNLLPALPFQHNAPTFSRTKMLVQFPAFQGSRCLFWLRSFFCHQYSRWTNKAVIECVALLNDF